MLGTSYVAVVVVVTSGSGEGERGTRAGGREVRCTVKHECSGARYERVGRGWSCRAVRST